MVTINNDKHYKQQKSSNINAKTPIIYYRNSRGGWLEDETGWRCGDEKQKEGLKN